jgi:phosphonate transport system substrate-binding protein
MSSFFRAIFIFLTLGLAISCDQSGPAKDIKKVSLEKGAFVSIEQESHDPHALHIAVGGMITPREGFAYYRRLLDYIQKKTGRTVEFIDRENYSEINAMLESGDIDAAFVCSGPYVDGHEKFGLELLVQPMAYGDTMYYSYIIVHADSHLKSFEALRYSTFAFTDPESNSGKLVPTYMLSLINETPDSFFKDYVFTYAHDKSIKAVAQGLVDGAAVDSLVWEYINKVRPENTAGTKIIHKSPPYGIPPLVVRPGLKKEIKDSLKRILLDIHVDPEGREILKGMMVDRFVAGEDSQYDSVRQMKDWIKAQNTGNRLSYAH